MRKIKFIVHTNTALGSIEKEGYFHQFGIDYAGFISTPGGAYQFSVAIVEDTAGKIWTTRPENITFLSPPENVKA